MQTTHLDRDGRLLCGRVTERFSITFTPALDAPITCRLCALAGQYTGASPLTVETCDACGTGRVTSHESYDLPDRFDPSILIRWRAWTACDLHGHDTFGFAEFRRRLELTLDGLTDEEYIAARGGAR